MGGLLYYLGILPRLCFPVKGYFEIFPGECRDKTCPGIRCSDLFVHGSGVVLPDGIGHGQHLHRKGAGAQLNFDLVP